MMVTGAVGGSVMIAASLIPAAVFADYHGLPVTGRYSVATDEAILIDRSRLETFENDGSYREIPVHFYYPEEATEEDSDTMPLIVFSHGAFGYYQSNTSTYMELASHGYVVVSLDHPYHSFYTRDTDGKTVIVDSDFLRTVMEINDSDMSEAEVYDITSGWMEIREADMNYVIDEITRAKSGEMDDTWFFGDSNEGITKAVSLIDIEKIGLIGHSLGGATSVTVGRRDDVSAVVDLDGTMLGEETGVADGVVIINDEPYETPLLAIEKEDHHAQRVEAERIGYVYSNNVILDNAREGYSTYFAGSEHMDFTDLPMFSPFLAGMLGKGSVDPEECMTEVNQIVLEFFDCYLKGEGEFSVNEYY